MYTYCSLCSRGVHSRFLWALPLSSPLSPCPSSSRLHHSLPAPAYRASPKHTSSLGLLPHRYPTHTLLTSPHISHSYDSQRRTSHKFSPKKIIKATPVYKHSFILVAGLLSFLTISLLISTSMMGRWDLFIYLFSRFWFRAAKSPHHVEHQTAESFRLLQRRLWLAEGSAVGQIVRPY